MNTYVFHSFNLFPDVTKGASELMYLCQYNNGNYQFIPSTEASKSFAEQVIKFLEERLEWSDECDTE